MFCLCNLHFQPRIIFFHFSIRSAAFLTGFSKKYWRIKEAKMKFLNLICHVTVFRFFFFFLSAFIKTYATQKALFLLLCSLKKILFCFYSPPSIVFVHFSFLFNNPVSCCRRVSVRRHMKINIKLSS